MGLLRARLFAVGKEESLLDVNFSTEITKKEGSTEYFRSILNPLE
jgi:hypothetical protein